MKANDLHIFLLMQHKIIKIINKLNNCLLLTRMHKWKKERITMPKFIDDIYNILFIFSGSQLNNLFSVSSVAIPFWKRGKSCNKK